MFHIFLPFLTKILIWASPPQSTSVFLGTPPAPRVPKARVTEVRQRALKFVRILVLRALEPVKHNLVGG